MNKKKISVIHSESKGLSSTSFLRHCYLGTGVEYQKLNRFAKEEHYLFLGHGTPEGLINTSTNGFVVSSKNVQLLREAKTVLALWCHSGGFLFRYDIPGVGFGMFISDLDEMIDNLGSFNKRQLDESNVLIVKVVAEAVKLSTNQEMFDYIDKHYRDFDNPVVCFNLNQLRLIEVC